MPEVTATLRLIACAESFSAEEAGALGCDDWPALAALLERELAVVTRLAHGAQGSTLADPSLVERVNALGARYAGLAARLAQARELANEELTQIAHTTRRLQAVCNAYRSAPPGSVRAPLSA